MDGFDLAVVSLYNEWVSNLQIISDTRWGTISNHDPENNIRIIWEFMIYFQKLFKKGGYPSAQLMRERRAYRIILASSDPHFNSFQFLKFKHMARIFCKEIGSMELIENLKELDRWRD